jgi:hypothetical protein
MKAWLGIGVLVFVGVAGWRVGGSLSPDALSMAVGVLFGVLAGVPTALLVMAGGRSRTTAEETPRMRRGERAAGYEGGYGGGYEGGNPRGSYPPAYWPHQPAPPPVIVLAGPQGMGQGWGQPPALNVPQPGWTPRPDRQFTVVGDRDGLLDDWQ